MKASLSELSGLVGRPLETPDARLAAARQVVEQGRAEVLVLSLGAEGALLVTAQTARRFTAPSVPVCSTVGAGDAMLAGVLVGLTEGRGLASAVGFGVAAGSASLLHPGTTLCTREDTERWRARSGTASPWDDPGGTFGSAWAGPCERGWPGRGQAVEVRMLVLVGYASAHGSTRQIAERVGSRIGRGGATVRVAPVGELHDLEAYDAVVLGSAIHNGAWLPAATEAVRANAEVLAAKPVWLFSVGMVAALPRPLQGRALQEGPKAVAAIERQIHPRAAPTLLRRRPPGPAVPPRSPALLADGMPVRRLPGVAGDRRLGRRRRRAAGARRGTAGDVRLVVAAPRRDPSGRRPWRGPVRTGSSTRVAPATLTAMSERAGPAATDLDHGPDLRPVPGSSPPGPGCRPAALPW